MSLAAQIMLSRKWIGNWFVWIAADVIYVVLYAAKDLWLTSVLYAVFLGLCLVGLRQWRAELEVELVPADGTPEAVRV
jgi:nicotinamide mononucleotide transporter